MNFYFNFSSQDPRAEQLKYELEKKDEEIDKLKKIISQWEVGSHEQLLKESPSRIQNITKIEWAPPWPKINHYWKCYRNQFIALGILVKGRQKKASCELMCLMLVIQL